MIYPEFSHGTAVTSTTGMYICLHDLHVPSLSFIGGYTHEIQHVDTPNISLCEKKSFPNFILFSIKLVKFQNCNPFDIVIASQPTPPLKYPALRNSRPY